MFVVSRATHGWLFNPRVIVLAMLALLALNAFAADKPLSALLPLNTPGYVSLDTKYLWDNSKEIRKSEVVTETITDMELASGLSLNDDVFSWTGQIAVMGHQLSPQMGRIPFNGDLLLQIRDQTVYEQKFPEVQAKLEKLSNQPWKTVEYKGVKMRQMEFMGSRYDYEQGTSVEYTEKIQVATVDGWLILTMNEVAMQNIIDVSKGEKPSLETHPLFEKTAKDLPKGNVVQLCINGTGILEVVKKNTEEGAKQFSATDYDKSFILGSVSNDANGLLFSMVACSSSLKIQEELKQLRADTGVLTSKSLAHSPDGTFAVAMLNNPDKYIAFVEKRILESLTDAGAKDAVGEWFAEYADPRSILKKITGEFTISAAYVDPKGFGFTAVGETKSAAIATMALTAFQGFAEDDKDKITVENGVIKLLNSEYEDNYIKFLLSATTRKDWLLLGSHPDWIAKQPAKPAIKMPTEIKDASIAIFGNFDPLPAYLKKLKEDSPDTVEAIQKTIDASPVKPDKWYMTISIDPDGKAERAQLSFPSDWPVQLAASAIAIQTSTQVSGKKQSEMYRIENLARALKYYIGNHDDTFPIMESPDDLKKLSLPDEGYMRKDSAKLRNSNGKPYLPNPSLSLKGMGDIEGDPAKIILLYDEDTWPNGAHTVAYLNGRADIIKADKWEEAKTLSGIP